MDVRETRIRRPGRLAIVSAVLLAAVVALALPDAELVRVVGLGGLGLCLMGARWWL